MNGKCSTLSGYHKHLQGIKKELRIVLNVLEIANGQGKRYDGKR